jgi:hypothetical protein
MSFSDSDGWCSITGVGEPDRFEQLFELYRGLAEQITGLLTAVKAVHKDLKIVCLACKYNTDGRAFFISNLNLPW